MKNLYLNNSAKLGLRAIRELKINLNNCHWLNIQGLLYFFLCNRERTQRISEAKETFFEDHFILGTSELSRSD